MNKRTSLILVSASSIALVGGLIWKAASHGHDNPSALGDPARGTTTALSLGASRFSGGTGLWDEPEDRPHIVKQSPIGLTASDGTGLNLTSLVARADVQDPLAFTELRMTFQNPQARQLEGTFRITLPAGASVSRFAMKVNGRWQEGEVVEKQAARVAYEDFLHRKQDPALLEQAAGNEFSARVFPIPPNGIKEIVISYSQELPANSAYVLPLRGLPAVGSLDLSVVQGSSTVPIQSFARRNFAPDQDFVVDAKSSLSDGDSKAGGLRAKNMVVAKVRAGEGMETASTSDPVASAIVLVDTSASRALGYGDQVEMVSKLVARMASGGAGELRVAAFDQVVVPIFSGAAKTWSDKDTASLRGRVPLGASDLQAALEWAAVEAKKAGISRVIVVGDGVATAGEVEGDAFMATLHKVRDAGVSRVDALAFGGIQDGAMLHRLVSGNFAHDGMVVDASLGIGNALHRMTTSTLSNVAINVPGAKWFWPNHLEGVQPGDQILVYADMPDGAPFSFSLGAAAPVTPALRSAEEPLLERAFTQAKIASLSELQGRDPQPERIKEIVDLSIAHRVVSPYTALLVLETERDYARFNITRQSLKDVLSMESGTLTVEKRRWPFDADAFKGKQGNDAPAKKAANGASAADMAQDRARGDEGSMGNPAGAPARSEEATRSGLPSAAASAPAATSMPAAPQQAPAPMAEAKAATATESESDMQRAEPASPAPVARPSLAPAVAPGAAAAPTAAPAMPSRRAALDEEDGRSSGAGLAGGSAGRSSGFGSGLGSIGGGGGNLTASGGASAGGLAPSLRPGIVSVGPGLASEVVQRIVRQNFGRFRLCYEQGLRETPTLQGRVTVRFNIDKNGTVVATRDGGSDLPDAGVTSCMVRSVAALTFPAPDSGTSVDVTFPLNLTPTGGERAPVATAPSNWAANTVDPYAGRFKTVMTTLSRQGAKAGLDSALAWHNDAPGDVLGLVALGEAYEASGEKVEAARAYGSLIDLFAARADLRRFAGERLERIKDDSDHGPALALAIDTYAKAAHERPDHPASHRLLAFARLRRGDYAGAFDAALDGARRKYPEDRFRGVDRILREDLGLIGAAWLKHDPSQRGEVLRQLADVHASLETAPSLRFVLNWETDANDVDFHIMDSRGGHAYYAEPNLPSGGQLYADVTTGYGPECFTIREPKGRRAGPYKLQAHYYSRGPMGYGMGKLEIIDHDGKGGLTFQERPYVVMVDHAFVDLGTVAQ